MTQRSVSVAEAKKHLSELLGRVAYGKEQIIITRRGRPMAKLLPAKTQDKHLAEAKGWLDEEDDFFQTIDQIVLNRNKHVPL